MRAIVAKVSGLLYFVSLIPQFEKLPVKAGGTYTNLTNAMMNLHPHSVKGNEVRRLTGVHTQTAV